MYKEISLNKKILNLIILIKDYKNYLISESMFLNKKIDWYKETEKYYNSLNNSSLEKINFYKNKIDFEFLINFKIRSEMLSTKTVNLKIFKIKKWFPNK